VITGGSCKLCEEIVDLRVYRRSRFTISIGHIKLKGAIDTLEIMPERPQVSGRWRVEIVLRHVPNDEYQFHHSLDPNR
jgi:hypothetical protein